jgi:arylsulfatase A-like enzyme
MHRTIPALFALGLAFSAPATRADAPPKPNIVFITSDDHRWDALGAAGNPVIHTPALDRLAARGIYFRQATTYVSQCHPIRATLLTGLPVHQHGAFSVQRQSAEASKPDAFRNLPTVPGLLRDAGYHTLLVGKWHVAADPWLTGFSEVKTWLPGGGADYQDPELARGNSRELSKLKGSTQQIFADDAIDFVRSAAAKGKPFFLWLAFTAPHFPLAPNSPESAKLYAGKSLSELAPPQPSKDIPIEDLRHYYEAVSDLDRQVGRVMAALEEAGLAESTAVVFLGDNGFLIGERGTGKVVPYEASIRVPLIVSSPGGKALAGPSDLPASSLDVPVTLVELAGLRPPSTWPGRELLGAVRRDPKNGLEDAFTVWADEENERWPAYRLVRTVRHKLVVWKDPAKPGELYDLAADPAETNNLYSLPEVRDARRDLEARLRAWMERTQDPARKWPKMTE